MLTGAANFGDFADRRSIDGKKSCLGQRPSYCRENQSSAGRERNRLALAASSLLNQTSAMVRPYPDDSGTWYFIDRSLPLIVKPSGGSCPT